MTRTIVFIHGAWVTPLCWERFVPFFEDKGYHCLAPAWPGKDRPIEAIRADPSPVAGLGVGEIVEHYDRLIRAMRARQPGSTSSAWAYEPLRSRSRPIAGPPDSSYRPGAGIRRREVVEPVTR